MLYSSGAVAIFIFENNDEFIEALTYCQVENLEVRDFRHILYFIAVYNEQDSGSLCTWLFRPNRFSMVGFIAL